MNRPTNVSARLWAGASFAVRLLLIERNPTNPDNERQVMPDLVAGKSDTQKMFEAGQYKTGTERDDVRRDFALYETCRWTRKQ